MSIETNQFVVTATTELEKLARNIIEADQTGTSGRATYLKALVGTTQAELGSPPRFRNIKAAKLSDEDTTIHLKAFEAVFQRFHEAVVKAAEATEPKPNADELRSRTGFSRSAGSTLRGFIRAGNDVTALAAHKVTKASLATPRSRRKFSVESLKKRAETLAGELATVTKNLNAANRDIARETLSTVIAQLATAAGMTEHMARDMEKAAEDNVAFHGKTGVFVPISLAAVREQRRAA